MKNLLLIFIASITFVALSSTSAEAQWTKLGQRKVNFRVDHDEMMVTAYEGTFRKLKLAVRKAPIFLHNVKIVYGNGERTNIKINKRLEKNTESRPFDLPGKKRIIRKIIFNYKSVPTFKGRAIVTVHGKR
jgi:hypothetical protein